MEPPHWQQKRCKVKEVDVGGRDVKAEVLRKRERECVMGNLGVAQGVHLVARSRRVVRHPQFTRPQARVAPTRNDSLYFAFGVG